MVKKTAKPVAIALGTLGVVLIAGCSGGTSSATESESPSAAATASASPSASATGDCPVTLTDAWVKAADSGMTGEFGVLTNSGDEEVTIVGGSSPAAGVVELHEVADGQMKAIDGGFVVPAGGTLTLEPGGYHVMLMQLTGPISPGDEVTTTLECSTGGSFEVVATAKEFAGGNEEYVGGGMGGMDDMNGSSQMPSMDGSQPVG